MWVLSISTMGRRGGINVLKIKITNSFTYDSQSNWLINKMDMIYDLND